MVSIFAYKSKIPKISIKISKAVWDKAKAPRETNSNINNLSHNGFDTSLPEKVQILFQIKLQIIAIWTEIGLAARGLNAKVLVNKKNVPISNTVLLAPTIENLQKVR